jgi:hypothetical protein
MAATTGDEHQRHQAAADGEGEDHPEGERDPAMDADGDLVETGQEPSRPGKRQQQENDEEADEEADFQS